MQNRKYAKAPLLYIQNGSPQEVKANMQHQYISKKHKNTAKQEAEKVYEGKGNRKRGKSFYELSEEQIEQETKAWEKIDEENEPGTARKPFTEMTIPEKLLYLTNKPIYAPTVSCVIRTTERTYRGIILEYNDDAVKLRTGRRNVAVKEKDIKDIRIIGL